MGVQMRTILEVADNSGAKKLACILPLGGSTGRVAGIGDVVTASVKEAVPDSNVKKGTVVKAVIVRTAKEHRRKDGTYIRFDQNAAVLINDAQEPIGCDRENLVGVFALLLAFNKSVEPGQILAVK